MSKGFYFWRFRRWYKMTEQTMVTSTEPTIGEHIAALLPRMSGKNTRALPVWPPDAFAICLSLLQKAAAYCTVLDNWPPETDEDNLEWADHIQEVGYEWRRSWVDDESLPATLTRLWKDILKNFDKPVSEVKRNHSLAQALLEICAAADEACIDAGSPVNREMNDEEEGSYYDFRFAKKADELLNRPSTGSSLCEEINSARARVLPKQHTPQNGLTARSLSLYIGLSLAPEVKPIWIQTGIYDDDPSFNLLLIPWPFEISRTQFEPKEPKPSEMQNMPDEFGFFTFRHGAKTKLLVDSVFDFYERAEAEFGVLGGIVLPEAAVSPAQFRELQSRMRKRRKRCMIIAGVSEQGRSGSAHDKNTVRLYVPDGKPIVQHKHHRWKLTRSQLMQYNLSGVLNANKSWWEHIDIGDRTLTFVTLLSTLTLSVLICEDLARPDPVADVVRVVGPNLVIALLMDGPQLKERWPTRHAIALADDPGCSVLSFTSLGMCNLSKPLDGTKVNRSRVIAIWKDPFEFSPREIELPEDHGAVILSISIQDRPQWTADGRSSNAGFPSLTGVYALPFKPFIPPARRRGASTDRPGLRPARSS